MSTWSNVAIAASLLVGLMLAAEVGYQLGRHTARRKEGSGGEQIGAIQGAVLGLLALLLGFSFAGAAERFLDRQSLIVEEANTIGTAYLRADLIPEPQSSRLRKALAEYVEHRLDVSAKLAEGPVPVDALARVGEFHTRMWTEARDGSLARPDVVEPVVESVNAVIEMHSQRMFVGKKKLPVPILVLLVICSLMSMGVIGFGAGLSGARSVPMAMSLALLIAAALWMTIDFDHPRVGLMRLSDAPLAELPFRR